MWAELTRYLGMFDSAVLSGPDADGYPFSVRCTPEVDHEGQTLRVPYALAPRLLPGPAGVSAHYHDGLLFNQKVFLCRGTLARDGDSWVFTAKKLVPGAGVAGTMADLKFMRNAARTATRYLDKRGLPRPRVPWDQVNALKAAAKKQRETG